MTYDDTLRAEISALLKPHARASWVAGEILNSHRARVALSADADFWNRAAWKSVRDAVGRVMNKSDLADAPEQSALPGFHRLQPSYVIEREKGNPEIVPTDECTDAELLQKADAHHAAGAAHFEHEEEIRRYIRGRAERRRRA